MGTRFIVDKRLKERREAIQEILRLTQKSPYPDEETTHLATFIKACFYEAEEKKRKELRAKEKREREEITRVKTEALAKRESQSLQELGEIPSPSGEDIELLPPEDEGPVGKREYVLRIYDNSVGVLVDKDENGNYIYNVVEPVLDEEIINSLKDKYARTLLRNNALFEDKSYFTKLAQEVSQKSGVLMSEILVRNVRYYLEKELLGAGKLDPFILDERVKGIVCDGVHKNIKVDYLNFGEIKSNVAYSDINDLNKFMRRVAMTSGRKLDDNNPILDVVFQGLKFNGVLGVGGKSSKLTIRRVENDF